MSALTQRHTLTSWSAVSAAKGDDWFCYVACIKPTYDHLIRLAGQISGMLILSDGETRLEVLMNMPRSLSEQAEEVKATLMRIKPPKLGVDHLRHMVSSAVKLNGLARTLEAQVSVGAEPAVTCHWHRELSEILSLLKCASDPWSGLQPVQFEGCCACCAH
ncbi:hypothetical protein HU724_014055 [Pseudomonas iranensis]|uniref:hypothetical protein n=1 Tax=Pseudomonas iranensis TaxID=2745503 RepID=UPI001645F66B|nr:hypothetical protein [Pseudomonas iranensis]QXI20171.1 hypothetical protein HU724_014055 [Pseudomonas iranensis]